MGLQEPSRKLGLVVGATGTKFMLTVAAVVMIRVRGRARVKLRSRLLSFPAVFGISDLVMHCGIHCSHRTGKHVLGIGSRLRES